MAETREPVKFEQLVTLGTLGERRTAELRTLKLPVGVTIVGIGPTVADALRDLARQLDTVEKED